MPILHVFNIYFLHLFSQVEFYVPGSVYLRAQLCVDSLVDNACTISLLFVLPL